MSAPLPLRVCCMAVMAPALTETTPHQARIKLSPVSNSILTPKQILNGAKIVKTDSLIIKSNQTLPSTIALSKKTGGSVINNKIGTYKVVSPFASSKKSSNTANHIKLIKGSTQIALNQRKAVTTGKLLTIPNGNSTDFSNKKPLRQGSASVNNTMSDLSYGFLGSLKKMGMYGKSEDLQSDALSPPAHSIGATRSNGESATECVDVPSTSSKDKKDESDIVSMSSSVSNKLGHLNERTDYLMRRLRRLQAKKYHKHLRQQVVGYLNQQQSASAVHKFDSATSLSDLKAGLLQSEDMKNLSTAALVSLVRKLQSNQSVSLSRHLLTGKVEKTGLCMDSDTKAECNTISGRLMNSYQTIENGFDSDATECSSGGESCDESDAISDSEVLVPIHRRAEWKWSGNRGAIVSRWTWLQAQVSDLEYRIRQHSDIYKQIRASKGPVTLGDPPPVQIKMQSASSVPESSPCNISSVLSNVNHQASKLTQSLGNCLSPLQNSSVPGSLTSKSAADSNHTRNGADSNHTRNGVIGANQAGGDASSSNCTSPSANQSCSNTQTPDLTTETSQSVRCRPVKSFRKRKLLRTFGVHQVSRKAARLSTIKCQCYPPVSCPMCGGRYSNTQSLEPEMMSYTERVAILDSGFHPVLSFNEEVALSIHLESMMKSGDWQNKSPTKSIKMSLAERRKLRSLPNLLTTAQSKRLQKSASLLSSEKIRIKYDTKKSLSKSQYHDGRVNQRNRLKAATYVRKTELKKRKAAKFALASLKKRSARSMSSLSLNESILGNSASSSSLKELKDAAMRKKRESAYDINNIVIPYSMASATRLEKIQYKEIVTPKWKDLDTEEALGDLSLESLTLEEQRDANEDDHILRHAFCEAEEKKRFASFHTSQQARRARASRGDSATSEQCSPDLHVVGDQTIPNIPLNSSFQDGMRRRTASFNSVYAEFCEKAESMPLTEPWAVRSFPLQDNVYSDMLKIQPPPEPKPHDCVRFDLEEPASPQTSTTAISAPASPSLVLSSSASISASSSASSSACQFDDIDDPDWGEENGLSRSAPAKMLRR